ncbi:MAG: phosphoglucosamine mutase [Candidatus Eiseniibacteriota bacterium]|nr:MAG: phosphoglucosamine mutase [Candidatus Eisenbacteria bacterium]
MEGLMIGVSGVRGVVGETFTPELASRFASAFSNFVGRRKVVVGRDSRPSGEMLKYAVISGLVAGGSNVVDVDICATPTIQLAVEELEAGGGIAVTASHNPEEWNALKFISSAGTFLNDAQGRELLKLYKRGRIEYAGHRELGQVSRDGDAGSRHVSRILKLDLVDPEKIAGGRYRVALDCCNGAGCAAGRELLEALGCETVEVGCEPTGVFSRGPEPVAENLSALRARVREDKADAGFAFDPDADRMSLVCERGEALGEERTVCLSSAFVLSKRKGPVCANVSTTAALEDIARSAGSKLYRSKVGEAHVVEKMKKTGCVVGGEGNGGVILPSLHYGRDGLLAVALTLQFMAESGLPLSELNERFPRYAMVKSRVGVEGIDARTMKEIMLRRFGDGTISYVDGVRVSWPGKWVHVRKSRTEPVVRVIVESSSPDDAASLAEEVSSLLWGVRS